MKTCALYATLSSTGALVPRWKSLPEILNNMPQVCPGENHFQFPPVAEADEDGLVLIGGRVTPERVLEAYPKGIFPWYDVDELPLWWSPDPRFVLFPEELHISRSMQKIISRNLFEFRTDTAFEEVIHYCGTISRRGQPDTWITAGMKNVYTHLHHQGFAHSAETWLNGELVGGMYGILIGKVFFGESMFSKVANASKFAFIKYVELLQAAGVKLIDCQLYTRHLESLGGQSIDRKIFLQLLEKFAKPIP